MWRVAKGLIFSHAPKRVLPNLVLGSGEELSRGFGMMRMSWMMFSCAARDSRDTRFQRSGPGQVARAPSWGRDFVSGVRESGLAGPLGSGLKD